MSAGDSGDAAPATAVIYRWQHGQFEILDYCDPAESTLEVADSWLVSQGRILALELHRSRFLTSVAARGFDAAPVEEMWSAAIAAIPRAGDWFPRIELRANAGAPQYLLRLRNAPALKRSVALATFSGTDSRTAPTIKGPDLAALLRMRTDAQRHGADDAVLLSGDGYVIEAAHAALLWWRGEILCAPSLELERVDSVTAKSILTLAAALGTEVYYESVTPAELDGVELWAVNALHGVRIVTSWINGPSMAEQPGRLTQWRTLLDRLRKPIAAHFEALPE